MTRLAKEANRAATVRLVAVKGIDHNEIGMMEPAQRILEEQWRVALKLSVPFGNDREARISGVCMGCRFSIGLRNGPSPHRKGHGVLLDGEVGGAAGPRPSSSAKKLSSAPVLLTR
jgi:hypothetical protein